MKIDVAGKMANAKEMMTEGAFQQAGGALTQAKNSVREEAQKRTSPEIKKLITKLQSSDLISTEEIDLIKIWIVGDANAYITMENNFQDWISEYERLEKVIADYENRDCTTEDLLQLHGILEDAARVNYDIANFLENRDRVERFESAVGGGLDKNGREIIAKILTEKLHSPTD